MGKPTYNGKNINEYMLKILTQHFSGFHRDMLKLLTDHDSRMEKYGRTFKKSR